MQGKRGVSPSPLPLACCARSPPSSRGRIFKLKQQRVLHGRELPRPLDFVSCARRDSLAAGFRGDHAGGSYAGSLACRARCCDRRGSIRPRCAPTCFGREFRIGDEATAGEFDSFRQVLFPILHPRWASLPGHRCGAHLEVRSRFAGVSIRLEVAGTMMSSLRRSEFPRFFWRHVFVAIAAARIRVRFLQVFVRPTGMIWFRGRSR